MRNIRLAWAALIAGITLLWLQAEPILSTYWPFFTLRKTMMQYTGILGIGVMSVGMMLALRPVRVEPWLGGLDKTYRLHKWLGITGLVITIVHWAWAKLPKWAVGWGWLERPARGGPSGSATQVASTLETWLSSQRGFAEELGEKAFYIALILLVLALVKYFPYRLFIKTHKWLALAYLALVYHTVVLTKMAYWRQPIGWVLALMLLAGTVSSLLVLFKRVGKNRQVSGTVAQVAYIPELKVTRTDIRLTPGWKGHPPGSLPLFRPFRTSAPTPTPCPRRGIRKTPWCSSSPRHWETIRPPCTNALSPACRSRSKAHTAASPSTTRRPARSGWEAASASRPSLPA
mgnify:CR=1 FL=1